MTHSGIKIPTPAVTGELTCRAATPATTGTTCLGLYYAKARMYDAENRRFASVDPIKGRITEPMTMVQYLYVVDNPLGWVDLLGRVANIDSCNGGGTPQKPDSSIGHDLAESVSGAYKDFTSTNAQISSGLLNGLNGAESTLQNAETALRLVKIIPILGKEVEVVAVVEPIADAVGEARVIISELKSGVQAYDALVQINNDGANKAYVAVQNKDYWGSLKAYWDVVPQQAMMLFDCAKNAIVKEASESFFGRIITGFIDEPNSSASEKPMQMSVFPKDSDDFNPNGIIKDEYSTPNGRIIKWFEPPKSPGERKKAVYEWDEDRLHDSHYHYLGEDGNSRIANISGDTHLYPGDVIPRQ